MIFFAFDAWMIAKSLAKQQMDWQPMKERIGCQRSGIVKIIPEFEEGYTDCKRAFPYSLA